MKFFISAAQYGDFDVEGRERRVIHTSNDRIPVLYHLQIPLLTGYERTYDETYKEASIMVEHNRYVRPGISRHSACR